MTYNIPQITIDLESFPPTGEYGLSLRIRGADRDMINSAAHAIGLRQADFLRMTVINAAKEVMRIVQNDRLDRQLMNETKQRIDEGV